MTSLCKHTPLETCWPALFVPCDLTHRIHAGVTHVRHSGRMPGSQKIMASGVGAFVLCPPLWPATQQLYHISGSLERRGSGRCAWPGWCPQQFVTPLDRAGARPGLFQKHDFFCLREIPGHQPVEIHAAGESMSIPAHHSGIELDSPRGKYLHDEETKKAEGAKNKQRERPKKTPAKRGRRTVVRHARKLTHNVAQPLQLV